MTLGFLAFSRADHLLLADALKREVAFLRNNGLALPDALSDLLRHCAQQAQGDSGGLERTDDAWVDELLEPAPVLLRTYDETAKALRVSPKTVERLVAAGELAAVSIGRSRRVRQCDLEAFVTSLKVDPGPQEAA